MSYRVLLLGQLVGVGGQLSLFNIDYKVMYEPKRAVSVAHSDRHFLMSLSSGYQIACL